jgi:hypothetical protein
MSERIVVVVITNAITVPSLCSSTSERVLVAYVCDNTFTVESTRCVISCHIYPIVIIVDAIGQYLRSSSDSGIVGNISCTMLASFSVSLSKFSIIESQ